MCVAACQIAAGAGAVVAGAAVLFGGWLGAAAPLLAVAWAWRWPINCARDEQATASSSRRWVRSRW
jgi:hypothetical protein